MAYEKVGKDDLIFRDELAMERTKLAEERTYLAYIRTGMSLMLGGLFFIGFFREGAFYYIGYATVAVALVFLAYGFWNHRKTVELMRKLTFGIVDLRKEKQ